MPYTFNSMLELRHHDVVGITEIDMTFDPDRYYIFDCNGKLIGNPFGYKTHSAAAAQTHRRGYTVYEAIWRAFRAARHANPEFKLVNMIKQGAVI